MKLWCWWLDGIRVSKTKLLLQNAKHELSKVFSSLLAIHPNKPGKMKQVLHKCLSIDGIVLA